MAALPERLPDWRVAIDAGNGMNGLVMPRLSKKLYGLDVRALYWDLDGTFPHHEANPLKVETLEELQELVKKYEAKFGVAFDGDGDRVGFVDELGEPIPGDMLTALFARELLAMRRGTVLYDLRSSWSVPEVIREAGGTPVMCRVGHAHIKKQMAETGALFGGELSMHFYFSELANCESGDLAMLLLLKMLLREQKPLSELWRPLRRYVHSGEMNFEVKDAKGVMARLEASYAPVATDVSHLDGLRMEFRGTEPTPEDWWFNVRASNTEPLLRLNLETRSAAETARRVEEVSAMIRA
jgi:phosphomannomutase